MKMDGESKRKLSKRKDPEIALTYYHSEGYPKEAVIEYVMNTLNSNFEDWRRANPCASVFDFKFSVKKMSPSGALFDLNKLRDISKNVIAAMDAETVYGSLSEWAGEYDREFHSLITADPQYTLGILSIDRGGKKPRKDAAAWSDFRELTSFFFDPIFAPEYDYPEVFDTDDLISILEDYRTIYDPADDNAAWFEKIRQLAARHGCCPDMKLYRQDPGAYKAHVGDVSMVIRVAVCGRRQSPDLGEVMRVMGPEMVDARLARAIDELRRNGQAV